MTFIRLCAAASLLLAAFSAVAGSGDVERSLTFGGRARHYYVHVPAHVPSGSLPLVLVLHGGAGNGLSSVKMTGFDAESDEEGFLVVYPEGTDKPRPLMNALGKPGFLTWDAGTCCGYASDNHVDDVGFIRALVKQLEQDYAIDPKRVYATGISNGGMMSYTLACEAGDLFAAVGIVSGIVVDDACKPARPVSVIHFHGTADEYVPIDGGQGKKAYITGDRPPVQDSIDFWVKADGCGATPKESVKGALILHDYTGCRDGTEVTYYVIQGGGHAWPGGERMSRLLDAPSEAISATPVIWTFFANHPKP